jgi:hypothetical protein
MLTCCVNCALTTARLRFSVSPRPLTAEDAAADMAGITMAVYPADEDRYRNDVGGELTTGDLTAGRSRHLNSGLGYPQ